MTYASVLLMFISINVYLSTFCIKWLDYHYMIGNRFKFHHPQITNWITFE